MNSKPLLLLDVDGVLNPYAAKPNKRPEGYVTFYLGVNDFSVSDKKLGKNYIRVWVNPTHGAKLLALTDVYDLVWATTWNDHANEVISPRINLPTNLPVLHVDSDDEDYRKELKSNPSLSKAYFKSFFVKDYVGDRPFVWVDDTHTKHDDFYLSGYSDSFQLHWVDPKLGLLDDDFETLRFLAGTL